VLYGFTLFVMDSMVSLTESQTSNESLCGRAPFFERRYGLIWCQTSLLYQSKSWLRCDSAYTVLLCLASMASPLTAGACHAAKAIFCRTSVSAESFKDAAMISNETSKRDAWAYRKLCGVYVWGGCDWRLVCCSVS